MHAIRRLTDRKTFRCEIFCECCLAAPSRLAPRRSSCLRTVANPDLTGTLTP